MFTQSNYSLDDEARHRLERYRAEAQHNVLLKLAKKSKKATDSELKEVVEQSKQKTLGQLKVLEAVRAGQLSIEEGLLRLTELDRSYQLSLK